MVLDGFDIYHLKKDCASHAGYRNLKWDFWVLFTKQVSIRAVVNWVRNLDFIHDELCHGQQCKFGIKGTTVGMCD